MELRNWLKTHTGTQVANKLALYSQAGLAGVICLLAIMAFTNKETVVLQPVTLTQEAWIMESAASREYKESWGLFFAQLVGNVTPHNVEFVQNRIKPFLAPQIYRETVDLMSIEAEGIRNDRVVMTFRPKFVEYEEETDKVFVYGQTTLGGADSTKDVSKNQTFELRVNISNYAPTFTHIATYEGVPMTMKALALQAQKAAVAKGRK